LNFGTFTIRLTISVLTTIGCNFVHIHIHGLEITRSSNNSNAVHHVTIFDNWTPRCVNLLNKKVRFSYLLQQHVHFAAANSRIEPSCSVTYSSPAVTDLRFCKEESKSEGSSLPSLPLLSIYSPILLPFPIPHPPYHSPIPLPFSPSPPRPPNPTTFYGRTVSIPSGFGAELRSQRRNGLSVIFWGAQEKCRVSF